MICEEEECQEEVKREAERKKERKKERKLPMTMRLNKATLLYEYIWTNI